ncbi:MAG: Gldg family protein [Planctomycetes bacterium]|nr:Gldg family protein [Planctomycetota bacterium]
MTTEWGSRRRTMAWVHHGIQGAVLLGLLIMLNLLAAKFPSRMDMTSRRTYALSAMAEDLLRTLPYDIEIWVNLDPGMSEDKSLPNAMAVMGEMLEEFRRRTDHVKVYFYQGANTKRLDAFQKNWSAITPSTLFILASLPGGRENKKTLDIQELYQGNPTTGEVSIWKGEPMVIQTIRDLGGNTKRIVYESEGHREIVTADVRKMSTLTNFLRLNEGVEFRRLPLNEYKSVPVDCDLLMIMAPEQPFLDDELDLIKAYIERGGSLLVTIRPKVQTGLERLLKEYSVMVGENIVLDPQQYTPPSRANLVVIDFNVHPVNRQMANVQFLLPQCCTIDPINRKDNNWTLTPLAAAGPNSWEEKGDSGLNANAKPDPDERTGSMKLILAVEKTAKFPMDDKHKVAKIIVWGSALPFTNDVLKSPYVFQTVQGQYVVNHCRRLMDSQLLEVPAKDMGVKPLVMSSQALDRLGLVINWCFPAFGVALGALAWFLRRK